LLNNLTPLPTATHSCLTQPARRRGAPRGNTNALKHGYYSLKHPRLAPASPSEKHLVSLASGDLFDLYPTLIMQSRMRLRGFLEEVSRAGSWQEMIAQLRFVSSLVTGIEYLVNGYVSMHSSRKKLEFIHHNILRLVILGIPDNPPGGMFVPVLQSLPRVPPPPKRFIPSRESNSGEDLFQKNCGLSDFNSPSSHPSPPSSPAAQDLSFLTDRQWRLILPCIPERARQTRRGRPPANPRLLLAAIFWKLALHVPWSDLPAFFPPMLTCRRYYRRLVASGRMSAIFKLLYADLISTGGLDFPALLSRGNFAIVDHRVVRSQGIRHSWQANTALLFYQQAYQVFRVHFGSLGRSAYEI
jgi:transposase